MFSLAELEKEVDEKKATESEKVKLELDEFLKITIKNLDEKQMEIFISNYKKILVSGPAGCGKSMIALRKVLELEKDESTYKIIIYTKALAQYLIGKLKRADIRNVEENILCGEKFKKEDLNGKIDYIVIDEVQDFAISNLDLCLNFVKKGYYLFGDNGQQVYPEKTENIDIINYLKQKEEINYYKLNATYRFPRKIALFSEQIKEIKEELSENCINEGSEENIPQIKEFNSFKDEMNYIYNVLMNEKWENVGILVRRNCDVDKVFEALRDKGLPCDYKNEKDEKLDFSNNRPKIITYHSSKGLEFERVFIPQCNVYEDDSTNYNYREALYVACTRASQTLIISYNKETGKSPYLNYIDTNYYKFERK